MCSYALCLPSSRRSLKQRSQLRPPEMLLGGIGGLLSGPPVAFPAPGWTTLGDSSASFHRWEERSISMNPRWTHKKSHPATRSVWMDSKMKDSFWPRRPKLFRIVLISMAGTISQHPFKVIMSVWQSTDPTGAPLIASPTEKISLQLVLANYLCIFWALCLFYCSLTSFKEESSQNSFWKSSAFESHSYNSSFLIPSVPTDWWAVTSLRSSALTFPVFQSHWIRVGASSLSCKMTRRSVTIGIFTEGEIYQEAPVPANYRTSCLS